MDWSAHNAAFIMISYAVSGICLAGMALVVLLRDRQNAKAIKKLKE